MAGKDSGYCIFVGGLPWFVTEPELEDAFSRFGKIIDSKVILERDTGRPRGFGFVTFSERRGMEDAIREMHGSELGDRVISVNKAQRRMGGDDQDHGDGGSYPSGDLSKIKSNQTFKSMAGKDSGYSIFVFGLSWHREPELEDVFSCFGKIIESKVILDRDTGIPRGFGFVTFSDRVSMEDAISEMHGCNIGDAVISVSRAWRRMGSNDQDHGHGGGERSLGQYECFKCSRPGHLARDCTSTGGYDQDHGYGGRGGGYGGGDKSVGQDECFICGLPGHIARECPSTDGDDQDHGSVGTYPSSGSGSGYGGDDRYLGQDECFQCGRPGHFARECPSAIGDDQDHGYFGIFVRGLSWDVTERRLEDAFSRFGKIIDSQVILERDTGRSRGFGFVTFSDRRGMEDAIREMDGSYLHERVISVNRARRRTGGDNKDHGYDGTHPFGGRGSGYDEGARSLRHDVCFNCGQQGHFARECPSAGSDDDQDHGSGGSYSSGERGGGYGGVDQSLRQLVCFNRGQQGHQAREWQLSLEMANMELSFTTENYEPSGRDRFRGDRPRALP